jgi:isoleucyl-tRNA synthetase
MPVWESDDGDRIVIGSVEELEKLSSQKVKDLHRPYIDEIIIKKDGKTYKRRPEVLDSWFEAASMPYGQVHYPFENREKFDKNFPGDYISEYDGQVRAWFYVMHVLSNALFGKNSFKNVIVSGVMSGDDGRKMSKTYQNYTDPKEVLETIGGDALRLYLMNSPLMLAERANFNYENLRTKSRNVINPLWNSLKFFLIYANEHGWEPKNDEVPETKNALDRWIIARLHETIRDFTVNIEAYVVPPAVEAIETFVDDLSRWYVRRSRTRIASGDEKALATFYYVLLTFARAAAPIIPFIAENIYKRLSGEESVHLVDYPKFDEEIVKGGVKLMRKMGSDRAVVQIALARRAAEGIPVKQPLQTLTVNQPVVHEELVKDEVNVKEIVVTKSDRDALIKVELDTNITPDLEIEGCKREIERTIQELRKEKGLSVSDKIAAVYLGSEKNEEAVKKFAEEIKKTVGATSLKSGSDYEITKKN